MTKFIIENRTSCLPKYIKYTADFGHSGPRLAIASCGHSGNCTLRHWIRSHDRAQYGSCQSEASLAIASLDQNGTTHWHLPLWPQLAIVIGAQSGCHMVIYGYYYFFNFYTKMRRLDGSRVVPGVIPAPLLLWWYGNVQLVSFFSFLSLLSKLLILEQLFFRWFHVVPVVFGSFMLTCYLEPSWFPFFKILSPGGETNHFCKKKKNWIF